MCLPREHVLRAEKLRDGRRRRSTKQFGRRAGLNHSPSLQQNRVVAERPRLGEVVRDVQHGHPELTLQATQHPTHVRATPRIERGEWLVEEQDVGTWGQRARERHYLTLSATERLHGAIPQGGRAESLGHGVGVRDVPRTVADVAVHAEVWEQISVLVYDPERPVLRRDVRDVIAPQEHRALLHAPDAGDRLEEGCLPCSGGSEDDPPRAARQRNRNVSQGERASARVERSRLDHRIGSPRAAWARKERRARSGTRASSTSTAATGSAASSPYALKRS